MRASFSCTSSKAPSGRPNWIRVRACSAARRRQVLAIPVQHAPKVVRPKSNTVKATFSPLPNGPRMFSFGTRHVVEGQPGGGRAADAELFHPRLDDAKAGHVGRDEKGRHLRFLAAGHRRAGHDGQHVGDRPVGDVALLAVEHVVRAVGRGRGRGLHVRGVRAGLGLRQREGGQLPAGNQVRKPARLLLRGCRRATGPACRSNDAR